MRALIAAAAVTFAALPRAAAADPSDDLGRAREIFMNGDCGQAVPLFKDLLFPEPRLADNTELAEAHLLLGVCQLRNGNRKQCDERFLDALRYDEGITLDAIVDKEASERFEEVKAEYLRKKKEDEEKRKLAEERDALKRALANMVVIEKRPYYINFIPFGAGQFQNGDNGWGLFFSVSQAVTGGTSVLLWAYQVIEYGFPMKIPLEDVSSVRRLQQIEVAAGVACIGLMIGGVIHALMNYEPTVQRKPDESFLPDHLRDKPAPKNGKKPSSILLLPTPDATGAAVQLTWRF